MKEQKKAAFVQGQSGTRSYLVNADGTIYRRNQRYLRRLPPETSDSDVAVGSSLETPISDVAVGSSLDTPNSDVTVRSSLDTPNGDTAMGSPTDKTGRDLDALPKDNQYRRRVVYKEW